MKNKILVIFTGGTIGCSPKKDGKKVLERRRKENGEITWQDYFLLTHYADLHQKDIHDKEISFEVREPLNTDSNNMTLAKWNALIAALKDVDFEKYAGIVITHGTDTLAYTSALLSVLLAHVKIPVMLVSSNEHLYSPLANGHKNFEDALNFICSQSGKICGTYVPYSYDLRRTTLYLASQIKQSQAFTNRYESLTGEDFGYIENGIFYVTNLDTAKRLYSGDDGSFCKFMNESGFESKSLMQCIGKLENCVMLITPYVGLDYSNINIPDGIKAVLHATYHSSTFCIGDADDSRNFTVKCLQDKCRDRADLYFAPFISNEYAASSDISALNAGFILNSSLELAYAKLLIAYNVFDSREHICNFLKINF